MPITKLHGTVDNEPLSGQVQPGQQPTLPQSPTGIPWPKRAAKAVAVFTAQNASIGASEYPEQMKVERRQCECLARLLNAHSSNDIALVKNTSKVQ